MASLKIDVKTGAAATVNPYDIAKIDDNFAGGINVGVTRFRSSKSNPEIFVSPQSQRSIDRLS